MLTERVPRPEPTDAEKERARIIGRVRMNAERRERLVRSAIPALIKYYIARADRTPQWREGIGVEAVRIANETIAALDNAERQEREVAERG